MNSSHLSHRPSQGRGSLDRRNHQARCPHFHSQRQGSTPNLQQETKARLLGHGLQHHGKCQFYRLYGKLNRLLSYPRDTVTALHPQCHPDCLPSRCSLFPLLRPLLGWTLEETQLVTRNIEVFRSLMYTSVDSQYTPFSLVLSLLWPTSASSLRNSSSSSSSSSSGWCMDTTVPSGRETFGPITTLKTVHSKSKWWDGDSRRLHQRLLIVAHNGLVEKHLGTHTHTHRGKWWIIYFFKHLQ